MSGGGGGGPTCIINEGRGRGGAARAISNNAIREKVHDNTYFHPECIGQTDKWKCPTCTEAL